MASDPLHPVSGTVVYAKDLDRVSAFYGAVIGLAVVDSGPDTVVLRSAAHELVLVRTSTSGPLVA